MFLHNLALHDRALLLGECLFTLCPLFFVHPVKRTHTQERNDQRNTGQDERNETDVVDLTDKPQGDIVLTFFTQHLALGKSGGRARGRALVQMFEFVSGSVDGIRKKVGEVARLIVLGRKRSIIGARRSCQVHAIEITILFVVVPRTNQDFGQDKICLLAPRFESETCSEFWILLEPIDRGAGEHAVDVVLDLVIVDGELIIVKSGDWKDAPHDFKSDHNKEDQDVQPSHPTNLATERDETKATDAENNLVRNNVSLKKQNLFK